MFPFLKEIDKNGYLRATRSLSHRGEAILEEMMTGSFPELMEDRDPKNEKQKMSQVTRKK